MKLKNSPLASLICVSLLGSAALSNADVLVAENFDSYADGALNGANGGIGFSDAWNSPINVGGGIVGGNSPSFRNFTGNTFGNSGTLWVSFDWGYSSSPTENGSYGGLTFYAGGGERFLIGNTWPGASGTHGVWRMSNGGTTTELNHPIMKTAVAKITLGAGSTSTVELWVGPAGSSVDVSGPALATVTTANLEGVDGIRIMGQDFGGVNSAFDNFIIGETMADVPATDTPPAINSGSWMNTAGGDWSTGGNWLDDTVATGSGSTANFNTLNITADTTVNLDSARTIGNLVFGDTDTSSVAGWTLTGSALTLAGTTPTITVNALGTAKTVSISAAVGGTAGLTKSGTGTLTLSGANFYTGLTDITAGTLQLQAGAFSTTARDYTIGSDAVLNLDGNTGVASGITTIDGTGTLRITGGVFANEFLNEPKGDGRDISMEMDSGAVIDVQSGATMYNGGWQNITWTSNLADLKADGTFDLAEGQNVFVDALTGTGSVGGANFVGGGGGTQKLTVGVDGGSGIFSGSVSGGIGFTKTGVGTQTLSGTFNYSGNTTVEEGTLSIGNGGGPTTLSDSATVSIAFGASMHLNFTGNDTVGALEIDGSGPLPGGTYNSSHPTYGDYFTGTGSLVVPVTATPYELWANSFTPAIGLPAEDDDNDGVSNFEEFAFGLDPTSGASVNPITAPLDQTDGTFSYTRRSTSGLTYSVWFSEDLAAWTKDTGATEGTPITNGDNETVEVTLSTLPGDPLPAKLFIQVRAD